ncbi:hypothetical protein J2X36_003356 [Methylobacterium sp. BE186]|nr:hypothetical protein [Methylobacterium sp. BE186]
MRRLVGRQLLDDLALPGYEDAIGQAEHFGQV